MDAYRDTLDVTGIGGLLAGIDRCAGNDRSVAIRETSRVVPDTVSEMSARAWRVAAFKSAITISAERGHVDLVLPGCDLSLLEALAAVDHRGSIQILTPGHISDKQIDEVRNNVPAGLVVSVLAPGTVPIISRNVAVLVTAFEAGGGYLLVEREAARALGAIRGQQFTGDIIALLPLGDQAVHGRPANWQMVRRDQFSGLCQPAGLETVTPNI
ncbi:hypothetical protein QKW60_00085 [Defluviimonas aestuarii]|uniref:hypothetical protein n=1 Tax=Albidovulum aestuarii TaxID=1130726 RepID=UPI00249ACAAE|nr:hypothetical protein [Defluviimonas aestuarii]MDI3334800.1 hypothetical protein [Defluviimonas aestuarii]